MEKITLEVKEVAELIGVSPATIYNMVAAGEIPFRRVRYRIIFHRGVIEAWLRGDLPVQKQA